MLNISSGVAAAEFDTMVPGGSCLLGSVRLIWLNGRAVLGLGGLNGSSGCYEGTACRPVGCWGDQPGLMISHRRHWNHNKAASIIHHRFFFESANWSESLLSILQWLFSFCGP